MLQNKFEMPLDLQVKQSTLFNTYLIIVLILSVISIFISSLHLILQLGSLVLLILMTAFLFKKYQRNKITRLILNRDDKWKIEVNNKEVFDAELEGECIVTYYLSWLNFKVSNHSGRKKLFHVLLLPGSLGKNELRQLRVRLRFLENSIETGTEEGI